LLTEPDKISKKAEKARGGKGREDTNEIVESAREVDGVPRQVKKDRRGATGLDRNPRICRGKSPPSPGLVYSFGGLYYLRWGINRRIKIVL